MATANASKNESPMVEKCEGWEKPELAAVIGGSAEDNSFANATYQQTQHFRYQRRVLLESLSWLFYVDSNLAE